MYLLESELSGVCVSQGEVAHELTSMNCGPSHMYDRGCWNSLVGHSYVASAVEMTQSMWIYVVYIVEDGR